MAMYIRGMACISHHNTIDEQFVFEASHRLPGSSFLRVTAPDYKEIIPPALLRRSSHILKMGISAGLLCLKRAGVETPDAIITGTAMGCFEDTDKFLRSIADNDERLLNPTPFIQSTHNTVAGQIALITKSQGYNFTYVHQNISFESALIDAQMLLAENEASTVLAGAVDELNAPLEELFDRAGHIKHGSELDAGKNTGKGFVAGEGAAFFVLESTRQPECRAAITKVQTFQKIEDAKDLEKKYSDFLSASDLSEPSLILSGMNGDQDTDEILSSLLEKLELPHLHFKNLCGEYFASSAFATWLAARSIEKPGFLAALLPEKIIPRNILIINKYLDEQYSFILLQAC